MNDDWSSLQQNAERLVEEAENAQVKRRGHKEKIESKESKENQDENQDEDEGDMPAPPPVKKTAGWGEESKTDTSTKKKSRRQKDEAKDDSDTKQGSSRNKHADDNDEDEEDDIMVIPAIEDDFDEDPSGGVVQAPQRVRTMPTLQQLDSQIPDLQLFSNDNSNLDLNILIGSLIAREKLVEPDESWEFSQLLEQVSQTMTKKAVS